MKNYSSILFAVIGTCFITCGAFAAETTGSGDEDVFLSMTRETLPMGDMPTNLSKVTEREIQKTGAKNIGQALDLSTNIGVGKYGTLGSMSTLILRGALDKQVLLLIDGRPANDITLGGYNYGELSTANIERVEVIRGAASSVYGANALAGVVNVITKEACFEEPVINVNSSWGGFGEQVYGLSASKKHGDLEGLFSASKQLSAGFMEDSACDDTFLDTYVGYDSGRLGRFKLKTGIARYDQGMPGKNTTPVDLWDNSTERAVYDPLANQKTSKDYFNLSHEKEVAEGYRLTSRMYGSADSGRYTSPRSTITNTTDKMSLGLEMRCSMPHGFTAGYELREDSARHTNEVTQTVSYDGKVDFMSLYLQENISPFRNINTIAGLRYDHHSYFGGETSPQLTVVWKASNKLKLSGNIGKSYRAPAFEDLFAPYTYYPAWGPFPGYDTQGNPDVRPETSVSYDLGIEQSLTETFSSKITIYRQDIEDLIEWSVVNDDPAFQQWRPSNVSRAQNQGVELDLKRVAGENLSYGLNYTYLDSRGKTPAETDYKTLMYRPQNTINLMLTWVMPRKMELTFTEKYVGSRYDESDDMIPAYQLFNIRLEKSLLNYIRIFIAVDDLTDTRYFTRTGYPLPGRVVSAGINATF